jgi:heme-degrading monooxygenase HmoA
MFVNIIRFPKIKDGKDAEFRQWFEEGNRAYLAHRGFIRRVLLQPCGGGEYVGLLEHESRETFMAMHTSPTQA